MFGTYHKLAFVTMATGGHSHGQLAVNLQSMMMEYQGACSSTPKIISPLRLLTTVKGDTKIYYATELVMYIYLYSVM